MPWERQTRTQILVVVTLAVASLSILINILDRVRAMSMSRLGWCLMENAFVETLLVFTLEWISLFHGSEQVLELEDFECIDKIQQILSWFPPKNY